MAESAISFLLGQLSEVLRDERKLLGGLKQEVQCINDELKQMMEFLRVADAREETDSNLKEWVGQLRDISFDVEDVLDEYMLRFGRHRSTNGLMSGCHIKVGALIKNWRARHQTASEIQAIRYRLGNVVQCQEKYKHMDDNMYQGSTSTVTKNEMNDSRREALFLEDEDVVGIKGPKKQLIDWIGSMDGGFNVISVVGTGGLGKTTLAKKVFDDEWVSNYFDRHVWVVVSDFKDLKHLLVNLIEKLVRETKEPPPQGLEHMSNDDMGNFIFEFLNGKKYIIALDDVWKLTTWEAIKFMFPRKGCQGCVIITTRFKSIGDAACSETYHVCNLKPLSPEQSERLLFKRAFPRDSCPPHLSEIVGNILKRCEGLPLAIVLMGGLLAKKKNKREELEFLNRSLSRELKDGGLVRLHNLFSLSYNDLPYFLKYCVLYLSIFPEGSLLEKEKIIRLWSAEGFVQLEPNKCLDMVAEDYLNDLCNRSLIQVADKSLDERVRAFRIHDLLREYIASKARELNVAIIHEGEEPQWPNKIRRLAIQKSVNLCVETNKFEHLRSLLLSNGDVDIGMIKEILKRCKLLKVLDLRGSPVECIPDEIFKLYHLKYLSLRDTRVKLIPQSIRSLQNLETLDLKNTYVTELPKEILQLQMLRHLLLYKYSDIFEFKGLIQSFKAPYNIGSLRFMQKLSLIDADEVGNIKIVKEIGKLTQLRRLGIAKLRREDGEELCTSIEKLTSLRSLVISSIDEDELLDLDYSLSSTALLFLRTLVLCGCLEKVPRWISSLHALSVLDLRWSKLKEDPLSSLEDLPNLTNLVIQDADVEGLTFKARKFQNLKELNLDEFRRMKWVRVEEESMPSLEDWIMIDCELLRELPQGIEHLTNLQYLRFHNMPNELMKMVSEEKRGQGDNWKLAHVPHIRFSTIANGSREYQSLLNLDVIH